MLTAGLILLILGVLLPVHALFSIGLIILLIGVFLDLLSAFGALGSRKHYW